MCIAPRNRLTLGCLDATCKPAGKVNCAYLVICTPLVFNPSLRNFWGSIKILSLGNMTAQGRHSLAILTAG